MFLLVNNCLFWFCNIFFRWTTLLTLPLSNISFNNFLSLWYFFFWLFSRHPITFIYFSEFNNLSIKLCLPQSFIIFRYFRTTHDTVEFTHAIIWWQPNIVMLIINSFHSKFNSIYLLIFAKIKLLKHFMQKLVLGDNKFVWNYWFFATFYFWFGICRYFSS